MTKQEFNARLDQLEVGEPFRKEIDKWYMHDYVTEIEMEYSGGGCYHLMFHMKDKRIINIDIADEDVEISYYKWDSTEAYYNYEHISDDESHGFGFEYMNPFYNDRTAELTDTIWILKWLTYYL